MIECRKINRRHYEIRGATALTYIAVRGPIPGRYSDPGMHLRCVCPLPLFAFTLVLNTKRTDIRIDWRTYVRWCRGTSSGARVRACVRARACTLSGLPGFPPAQRFTVNGQRPEPPLPSRECSSRGAQSIGTSHVRSSSRKSLHPEEAFLEREFIYRA